VKYEFRSGTQDQDYIQGFPGIENELQVSYELKQAVPYVRAVSNTQLCAANSPGMANSFTPEKQRR
jgi:predicted phage tail protein